MGRMQEFGFAIFRCPIITTLLRSLPADYWSFWDWWISRTLIEEAVLAFKYFALSHVMSTDQNLELLEQTVEQEI